MKKFNLAKIISLVFVCVMLVGALAITAFATEDEKVEILAANVYYGDYYKIAVAVNAPEGAVVTATNSKGVAIEVIPFADQPTVDYNGVTCKNYILKTGVAAQAIDEVFTFTVTYGEKTAYKNVSVLQYIYVRSQMLSESDAELEMLQALLNFAIKADIFLDKTPADSSFNAYQYVKVTGATVNGVNPTGMYAKGATPFANLDAIEFDAEKYELSIKVNDAASTLDALKALVVADEAINVVVEIVEKTHVHNYTPKVTDPTCIAAGYTTYTCEECGASHTDNKTDALGHIDENEDFKCERCSQKALPAADSVLTLEQAIKLAKLYAHNTYTTDKYYVTATIKDVYNTQYGNMYLTDGTNEFTVYGTYSADGKTGYSSLSVKPVKGDTVTIYGIIGTYSNAAQIKNGWITEHIVHEECEYTEVVTKPTCTKPGYTTYTCICGDSYEDNPVDALGHNYIDGACERCGAAEPSGDVTEKTEMSVSKSHTDIAKIAGVTVGQNTGKISDKKIDLNEDITIVCAKGKSTSDPCVYSESIRLYQGGATLTINAAEGCTIKTIVITLANSTAGDGPISVTGGTASALVNYVYTITANEGATEIVVTTTGTDKNSRLYVADIEVVYEK